MILPLHHSFGKEMRSMWGIGALLVLFEISESSNYSLDKSAVYYRAALKDKQPCAVALTPTAKLEFEFV